MTEVVLDASVIVKWVFPDRPGETHETGRLSLGQAAQLAGYSTRTFMEPLGRLGVPVFDYPPEELRQEPGI